uniref:Uncharacterized protein n=1 Tax=Bracon brevicornis TaxID=1563983 RepID=A0A6V7JCE3_9HYME
MAGKPEHQVNHQGSSNQIHQHYQQQHHHQQQQQHYQATNQTVAHRTNNDSQNQESGVLVYVPNDNFTYTTIDHNNGENLYQQNNQSQQYHQNAVTYKTNYNNQLDQNIDTNCSINRIDNDKIIYQNNHKTINDIGATGSPINIGKIDLGGLSVAGSSLGSSVTSPGQQSDESLSSGNSDSGVVITNRSNDKTYSYDNNTYNYQRSCNYQSLNDHNKDIKISEQLSQRNERGCESVRSDTAESAYSSSSLSSPECNSVQLCGDSVQQAVRLVTHVASGGNNVALTMNNTSVVQQHNQQQLQQASIAVPPGWKRICTNGLIIYIR